MIEVSRKGSPKPGAAPAAVGTAEIRRIVGTGSGCGEVPKVGDSVRGWSCVCARDLKGKVLRISWKLMVKDDWV